MGFFKLFNKTGLSEYQIHKLQDKLFTFYLYGSTILYIIVMLGLFSINPKYIENMNYYVSVYIGLFLVLRFNDFRHVRFTNLDRKIAFSAGVFILTTTLFHTILLHYPDIKSRLGINF